MAGVVLRPGEGEVLFGGRIVLKATFDQLCITESFFDSARDGASPHIHHHHADSFYVLDGEFVVLVHDEEHHLTAGGYVCAPPEVVHGFRTASPSRFLNFHTPDGGFTESLRSRNRGEPGPFDSADVEPGSGRPPTDAVLLRPGGGERLNGPNRVATIKAGREEIAMIEFELEPGFEGPDSHAHDDHIDSFYVLDGEVTFLMNRETVRLGPGSFVAAPLGVEHAFSNPGPGRARVLNVHAPGVDFHERIREFST
jgi:quercetin dioxygenase-like cupin family protein